MREGRLQYSPRVFELTRLDEPLPRQRHDGTALHRAGRIPQLDSLRRELQELGRLLARYLPPTGENPNELPDMPRFDLK